MALDPVGDYAAAALTAIVAALDLIHSPTFDSAVAETNLEPITDELENMTRDMLADYGSSLPAGGLAGQSLVKASGTDYDVTWSTVSGTGTLDHAALTSNLAWDTSGHTGTASRLAGFSGAGAAAFYQIGVDVQAWDAELDEIAALSDADGNFIVGSAAGWVAESGATARTSLGLGTADEPQFARLGIGLAPSATYKIITNGYISAPGLYITERASLSSTATRGAYWTKNSTPAMPWFTDDTSVEHPIFLGDGTIPLTGEIDAGANTIGFTLQTITSVAGTAAVDWRDGNKAKITLTEDTTFSFTNPTKTCAVQIIIVQDSTPRTCSWPAAVKWPGGSAPTISPGSGAIDVVSLVWDGTNYYGGFAQNYS